MCSSQWQPRDTASRRHGLLFTYRAFYRRTVGCQRHERCRRAPTFSDASKCSLEGPRAAARLSPASRTPGDDRRQALLVHRRQRPGTSAAGAPPPERSATLVGIGSSLMPRSASPGCRVCGPCRRGPSRADAGRRATALVGRAGKGFRRGAADAPGAARVDVCRAPATFIATAWVWMPGSPSRGVSRSERAAMKSDGRSFCVPPAPERTTTRPARSMRASAASTARRWVAAMAARWSVLAVAQSSATDLPSDQNPVPKPDLVGLSDRPSREHLGRGARRRRGPLEHGGEVGIEVHDGHDTRHVCLLTAATSGSGGRRCQNAAPRPGPTAGRSRPVVDLRHAAAPVRIGSHEGRPSLPASPEGI